MVYVPSLQMFQVVWMGLLELFAKFAVLTSKQKTYILMV